MNPATFRARTRYRILNSLSRDTWRLMPFYVAATLLSLAALRYIFSGERATERQQPERMTPAMEAVWTDPIWTVRELLGTG